MSKPRSSLTAAEGNASAAPGKCPPGLYVVATPIGNLADVTRRARDVLAGADLIACEDTRRTGRLLAALGVANRLVAYHDHNAPRALRRLLPVLERGGSVALASDAGTPLISDPGYRLVGAALDAGVNVVAVPGPSSVAAALSVSGMPTDRFAFVGFLPPRGGARRDALADLSVLRMTVVLFESPRRLAATLADLAAELGDRPLAIARELTKRHEEVRRGRLCALAERAAAEAPPKGEIVLVLGPPERPAPADRAARAGEPVDAALIDDKLGAALGAMTARDAARCVAAETGASRRAVYARAVAIAGARAARDGGPTRR